MVSSFRQCLEDQSRKTGISTIFGGIIGGKSAKKTIRDGKKRNWSSLPRGNKPGMVLIDSGYGNNTTFLSQLEERNLNYLGGIAKNRKVKLEKTGNAKETIRVDELAASLSKSDFTEVQLTIEKPKTFWVAVVEGEISRLEGKKSIAIVMNASSFSEATEVDYFLTNVPPNQATPQWVVKTYSQRNWVEVFY
ncbi:transposase [Euhalothece natronophila Z-M001]|uniref:Transposase n=1 Tax=Euhalothece natronophila Z-M001 TaxID=522448 RepID=A0A5B8NQD2_9CHRO|nr:transposase [Euhalothece natronophila Z-M001]